MHRSPPPGPSRRRARRLTAVLALLATVLASLATGVAAPAGAVPVDALFTGTLSNPANGTSAPITLRVSSRGTDRSIVDITATLRTNPNPGQQLTVTCGAFGGIGVPALTQTLANGTGGVPSASPASTPTVRATGTMTWAMVPVLGNINVGITITATLTPDRGAMVGATADLAMPFNCFPDLGVRLAITAMSDDPYAIRTRHDGSTTPAGIDLTHMIDREPAGTPVPWERMPCMFLDAQVTNPATATPANGLATWGVLPGSPPGAQIRPGWSNGDPTGDVRTTQLCITDQTPADSLIVVTFRPNGTFTEGRVVIWVGEFVPYVGRGQGDVHNTTFDEVRYDFQGVGEYVNAVATAGGASTAKDFAVQSRLEAVPSAPVTVTTAVAAQVNGDRVTATLDPSGTVTWRVDGRPVRRFPTTLPGGGTLTNPKDDHWRVNWADNGKDPGTTTDTTMQVSLARWAPKDHLNIDELRLGYGLGHGAEVAGLFGSPDGDATNDLTPSWGGPPVSPDLDPHRPPYDQPLYNELGRSWLVTPPGSGDPQASLFDYLDPAHPDPGSYVDEKYPLVQPEVIDPEARHTCIEAGVTAHPQLDFCTYDIEITGARDIATYYAHGWHPV